MRLRHTDFPVIAVKSAAFALVMSDCIALPAKTIFTVT
jgi:hypothetical protein